MKSVHIARCVLCLLVVGASVTTTAWAAEPPNQLWWSLRPLRMPEVPRRGEDTAPYHWIKTPVDAFILATLQQNKLAPAAPTDKGTLLRRVYFDLTGLPPTPEQ